MPDSSRVGDWCQTWQGVAFYPLDPRAEEVLLADIAHALSNQCRFGGHARVFYSVAEHSVRVANAARRDQNAGRDLVAVALLHDAAEACLVDLPRPIKGALPQYREIEDRLEQVILEKFGLPGTLLEAVKHFDNVLLATEKRDVMGGVPPKPWDPLPEPLADIVVPWSSGIAERAFLMLALDLGLAGAEAALKI